ncbi:hypothetical protein FRC02_007190 [Tulasnella sp. 418]|nr:hypothetical protein FRC02_007190 [Tulasnella sp. 418]
MARFFQRLSDSLSLKGPTFDPELRNTIGSIVATRSDDWSLILDLCQRASTSELGAKTFYNALADEFTLSRPSEQLVAARLWGIILNQPNQDWLLTQCSSKWFLDAVKKAVRNAKSAELASPSVKERLMIVLGGASALYGKDYPQIRSLWIKLKDGGEPESGKDFDKDDPLFFHKSTPDELTASKKRTIAHGVAGPVNPPKEKTEFPRGKLTSVPDLAKEPSNDVENRLELKSAPNKNVDKDPFIFLRFDEVLKLSDVGLSASDKFRVTVHRYSLIFSTDPRTVLYNLTSRKVRQLMYDDLGVNNTMDDSTNAVLSPDGNILVRRRNSAAPIEALDLRSKALIGNLDQEIVMDGDKHGLRRSVWANNTTIYIPLQQRGSIIRWCLDPVESPNNVPRTRIFQPLPNLTRHSNIKIYTSRDERWLAVAGRTPNNREGHGDLQIHDVQNDESSVIKGLATFIVETEVYDEMKSLLIVADVNHDNKLVITVDELHSDSEVAMFKSVKVLIKPHAKRDLPRQIVVLSPLPIMVISTYSNSLYFLELHTGTFLHSLHDLDDILLSPSDGQSIIHRRRDSSFQRISVNEQDLIGWVRRVVKDDILASAIAIRTGLKGAEDIVVNDMHRRYDISATEHGPSQISL